MQTKTSLSFSLLIWFLTFIYCQRPPPRARQPPDLRSWHPPPPGSPPAPPPERFRLFHKLFRRPYHFGSPEYHRRYVAFKKNIEKFDELNKLRVHNASARYGVTKFSDLTPEEFKANYLSGLLGNRTHLLGQTRAPPSGIKLTTAKITNNALKFQPASSGFPLKVDWRTKGVVSRIRDQKSCGGCWAFSVVEMIESVAAISSGTAVLPLSVQEVIDCSNTWDHALWGCKGGDTSRALDWLNSTKIKLVPSSEYPLRDKPESCLLNNETKVGVTVKNYNCSYLPNQDEIIQRYVSEIGPVSVSVDATTWTNYLGGIIQFHCGENRNNHAVLIVGYDKTGDIPYYIVKNSWGDDFGDHGYVYVAVGGNVCGIGNEVSTVAVNL